MSPVSPAIGDRLDHGVHEGDLSQVLQDLRVFEVLNAITNGLQSYPRSRLRGRDGTRRIEEDSVTRSAEATTASGGIHIVPAADGVSGGPTIGAVVKDAGGT